MNALPELPGNELATPESSCDTCLREGDDPRVVAALEEFLRNLELGRAPDRAAFLANYPDIASEVARCLDGLEFIRTATSQTRREQLLQSPASGELLPEMPLGDYRIVREVGRGGMGVVYEAVQLSLGRRVALKVLPLAATLDLKQLQRFKNEAQAAAQLHHTNIVPVFGVGCDRGVHYYAMQFIDGQTLAAVIKKLRQPAGVAEARPGRPPGVASGASLPSELPSGDAPAPVNGTPSVPTVEMACETGLSTEQSIKSTSYFHTIARLGCQAALALEHAHQLGVVHRDIKPANLLLDVRGNLWITDFGLAHCQSQQGLTMTGDTVGTLRYMSPEQALGQHGANDQSTDVYSLGVTLYELLTLQPALDGRDRHELLHRIAFEEPRPPRQVNRSLPAELETIVLKAIEKNPAERYATAQELADDLQRFLKDEPIRARRATLAHKAKKWIRRHRPLVWSGGVFAVLLLALGAVALVMSNRAIAQERAEAVRQLENAKAQRRKARRAVDMVTQVAEKWLAHRAGMEPLAREFLEAALSFYKELGKEHDLDPDERLDIGLAHVRAAYIRTVLGQANTEDVSKEGIALLEELFFEEPSNAKYRSALAEGYVKHGWVLDGLGRKLDAVKALRRTVALLRGLVAEFPKEPSYLRELTRRLYSLAILLILAGNQAGSQGLATDYVHGLFSEAAKTCREVIPLFRKLPPELANDPDCRLTECGAWTDLAAVLREMGDKQQADELQAKGLALYEKLVADFPDNPLYQADFAGFLAELGRTLPRTRQQEAEKALRRALAIQENVVAHSPMMKYYQEVIERCYGDLLATTNRPQDRVELCQRAFKFYEKLAVECPTVAFYRTSRDHYSNQLAHLQRTMAQGDGQGKAHTNTDLESLKKENAELRKAIAEKVNEVRSLRMQLTKRRAQESPSPGTDASLFLRRPQQVQLLVATLQMEQKRMKRQLADLVREVEELKAQLERTRKDRGKDTPPEK